MKPIEVYSLPPLPARPEDAHKGSCGTLLIVAGSAGMAGAAAFAGLSAYRMGAGLVKLCTPECNRIILQTLLPEAVCLPFTKNALKAALETADAVVIGPGLGQSEEAAALADSLLKSGKPTVLDADGLNLLAAEKITLPKENRAVLTPHPGELARLLGRTVGEILADPEKVCREAAAKYRAVCLLKLHETLICDGETLWRNHTGCPALATGGSGDCLSGIIGALLADGFSPAESAVTGAFLHGRCGELAAGEFGERSVIARDIPAYLPAALLENQNGKDQNNG